MGHIRGEQRQIAAGWNNEFGDLDDEVCGIEAIARIGSDERCAVVAASKLAHHNARERLRGRWRSYDDASRTGRGHGHRNRDSDEPLDDRIDALAS
ncbi:hypothetical protein C7K25_04265 [Gulosibacter molinativorax]|uniref:Uncharacterized protein n=1 Tax=Gulosibacter molinativorax TaxID=256821 RepID=A0ABT7C712_9MICO|nr:hypothetical protein [Gulosibacter molinativorax]